MLVSIKRGIEIGLLGADLRPIDIEFFSDEHRQHGFDALADLRIFRLLAILVVVLAIVPISRYSGERPGFVDS